MYEAMQQLFGYGHPQARFWVVGLEEHCGDAVDIQQRIEYRTNHQEEFFDLNEFHINALGEMPAIEGVSVWRIASEIYSGVWDADIQIGRLHPGTNNLLLSEILPLPRPQNNQWPQAYHNIFATKEEYVAHALPIMVQRLINMVNEHAPTVVILHGKTHHNRWIRQNLLMNPGWLQEPVVGHATHTILWRHLNGTLWVRTNNLVNNGHVRNGPAQINQIVDLIRRELGL